MIERFSISALFFEGATTPEERRKYVRWWLAEAILWIAEEKKAYYGPAMALFKALEGLDVGQVDPMLRLPAGQKRGGKEAPPVEIHLKAIALASVEKLVLLGVKVSSAVKVVAAMLNMEPGALGNLRKKVSVERAKPPIERSRYLSLIEAFETEKEELEGKTKNEVMLSLVRYSMVLSGNLNSSPNPIQ